MKSNRVLLLILLATIIILVGVAAFLNSTNSRAVKKNNELEGSISSDQITLSQGKAALSAQEKDATDLENSLASAQSALAQINFLSSAESIDYDGKLFSIAASNNLQIASLTATPPSDTTENNNTYQLTTFTVNVEGIAPEKIFASTKDSTDYVSATISSMLAFTSEVANSPDFNTSMIPSINITSPAPMTDADIAALKNTINGEVQAGLTEDETQGLADDEIAALVQTRLKAMKPAQVQVLIEQAGITKPLATITIQVWTLKGA
jgi:hypothetical protein